MKPSNNERTWLEWMVRIRVVLITFVLGIELAVANLTTSPVPRGLFVSVIALWYALALFYVVLLRLWQETWLQARLQVLTDVAMAAGVVYVTGGIDSSFTFLFPMFIITAAILLPRYWAYLTASLGFILLGGMLELSYYGLIRSFSSNPNVELRVLQVAIAVNLVANLSVAFLASYLAAKLRKTDVQLREKAGALASLQILHSSIINSITGGVITTDLEGAIIFVNPAGERLLGRSLEGLTGRPVETLFAGELPQLGAARGELGYSPPGLGRRIFGMTGCALADPEGKPVGRVYTFNDLTHIRRLEREIRIRDRMAAVGRLASGIAHEIRNPLAAIAGSAQMLQESPGLAEDERQLLDIVRRESDRLNKIVTDFLAYSREKEYKFERIDLLPLLDETLRLLENRPECAGERISVVRRFEAGELPADADGDRMKQVFWNICDNAVRAMPEGGTLTVSARATAGTLEMTFADTGTGISQQHMENIFEPFHSNFASGTGLGLAIVYQIMQAHEGKVSVQPGKAGGTEVVLHLKHAAAAVGVAGGAIRG